MIRRIETRRLLDQVRELIRIRHYSIRTEQVYVQWIKRFILFHDKRHPLEMGADEVTAFLRHLTVMRNVAASTQNQALNAILTGAGSMLSLRHVAPSIRAPA
ncbi:phage integrase N-terminal SAM-like domain-containing protein [Steroidobacter sp. S1-65]|uniref:Phage integrase N-terminal SAM-like domain-containing protein n=1 Tax=Steroidobacter gossypii TaxID=2805490 RepID=A0ABS1WQ94_9GAMM|nr:phage integrase N-terminal SAM-like domain-containing protein [Steroidobacter gossypii]